MDLGLRGKKALITGGTRGIGRAIAEYLADDGCDVALCARTQAAVDDTVRALAAKGVNATGGAVDVRDAAALGDWIRAAADALGGLDIVVANVSGFGTSLDEAGWRAGFDYDILGTFNTIQAAQPILERSDAGSIVVISSVAAVEDFGGVRPYNAVKAALITYASNVATALAPKGVRVNTVSPGTIYFEGGVWHKREQEDPDIYEMALGRNPMGRMGSAEEVARAAVFLASPAASFITGTNVIVDGGLTRRVQF